MKTHSDFFSFRKIEKIKNNNLITKYSQLPTFLSKNTINSKNTFNSNKIKQKINKRYYLNSNRIMPNIKQTNIKSFSIGKKSIKLDSIFHLSNSNFYNTDSLIKNDKNGIKNLKLNSNSISNNSIKYSSNTMPKNINSNNTIYKLKKKNQIPLSKPKANLKKFKLINGINISENHNNNTINHSTPIKLDLRKRQIKNTTINDSNRKMSQGYSLQKLLNEKCLTFIEAKHSISAFDIISSYGVNTYKGIIRNYNEDRVAIIVNAKKPKKSNLNKDIIWPNISFFGIFDGHAGNKCAEYLKNNLYNYILESIHFPSSPIQAIQQGFQICEKNYINSIYSKPFNQYTDFSGSCAIVVLIINNQCYIANLGDSRAIYSYNSGSEFFQLSRDHKPNDLKEKKRIYKAGGTIFKTNLDQISLSFGMKETDLGFKIPFRINPGRLAVSTFLIIQVSRAFGDVEAKIPELGGNPKVLIADPCISKIDIDDKSDFILIGCKI